MLVLLVAILACANGNTQPEGFQGYDEAEEEIYEHEAELGDHFEGDIMLADDDEILVANPLNAIVDRSRRWPNGVVPYKINSAYSATVRQKILKALSAIENRTEVNGKRCVKFVKRTTQSAYVHVKQNTGCNSFIGRTGGEQVISIGRGCDVHGIIMHEFLHALGFYHEQVRADRDRYVKVNFTNIQAGREINFRKRVKGQTISHLGTRYNYGSVMHYGKYDFAKDRRYPTIKPLDPSKQIGQRSRLSGVDVERIQILYDCKTLAESTYFNHLDTWDVASEYYV